MRMVLICFSLIALFAQGALAMNSDDTKKRVLLFSGMSPEQTDAFYTLMAQTNPLVDGEFRPQSLEEADVVAYLLTSWSDAPSAPGAAQLPEIFNRIYDIEATALSKSIHFELDNGKKFRFVFYSLESSGFAPLKCFAIDLAHEATLEIDDEKNHLFDCIQGGE